MVDVKEQFEAYISDLRAQLKAASAAGSLGEDDQAQLKEIISDYRQQLGQTGDEVAAEKVFQQFKTEARRYARGGSA